MLRPSSAAAASVESPALSSASAALARKARFWDRIARKYAADPIADLPGYEATLQRVQGLLSTSHDVLEIGCGTGSTALRLAPHTRRLLATDVSAEMIAIAREKLAAQPMLQLSFAVADADAPVFGQGTWDAVLAFNLLHLVDDLDHAIDAAVQALRPGGLFVSKTACINEMNPLVPRLRHWQSAARAVFRRCAVAGLAGSPRSVRRGGRAPWHQGQGHPRLHCGPQAAGLTPPPLHPRGLWSGFATPERGA